MPVGAVAQARLFVVGMEHIMRKPLPNAPPGSRFAGIAAHAPPVGLPAMPVLFKKLVSKVSSDGSVSVTDVRTTDPLVAVLEIVTE